MSAVCPKCGEEFRLAWIGNDPPEPYGDVCGCPDENYAWAVEEKVADDEGTLVTATGRAADPGGPTSGRGPGRGKMTDAKKDHDVEALVERLRNGARDWGQAFGRPTQYADILTEAAEALLSSQARIAEVEGVLKRIECHTSPPLSARAPQEVRTSSGGTMNPLTEPREEPSK